MRVIKIEHYLKFVTLHQDKDLLVCRRNRPSAKNGENGLFEDKQKFDLNREWPKI